MPRWRKWVAVLSCGVAIPGAARAAPAGAASEQEIKAALLYNFSKYVEWPEAAFAAPADSITICVIGEGAFGAVIEEMVKGKELNGRPVSVREQPAISSAAACRVLFVASSERARFDEILARVAAKPILTVSDVEAAAERGAIIGLKLEGARLRFEVNLLAARQANVKLGSQLLKVAVRLIGQEGRP